MVSDINSGVNYRKMKTCVSHARKTEEITYYFCQDIRDPLLLKRHVRSEIVVKVIEPVFEGFTEMFNDKNY